MQRESFANISRGITEINSPYRSYNSEMSSESTTCLTPCVLLIFYAIGNRDEAGWRQIKHCWSPLYLFTLLLHTRSPYLSQNTLW